MDRQRLDTVACIEQLERENTQHHKPPAFRVRLEHLRFPPNVPAGLNPLVLFSLAYQMRATLDDPGGPILIQRSGQGGWRVTDGRHRALASMIAGRPDVLARETP